MNIPFTHNPERGDAVVTRCTLPLRAFVDPGYMHWLKGAIPQQLLTSLQREFGPDLENIPWETPVDQLFDEGQQPWDFEVLQAQAFIETHNPDLPFHGMLHGQRITCLFEDGLQKIQEYIGELDGELYQVSLLAAALHDLGHCGAAFFALAKPGRIPPGAHADMPVEVYTAQLVDTFFREHTSYDLLARLVANYIVISSAFGAMNPDHGTRLQLANVQPTAILGTLMRLVDVLPVSDFTDTIHSEANLLYIEVPATAPPESWEEYLESRKAFLHYVVRMMIQLDKAVEYSLPPDRPFSVCRRIGWSDYLQKAREDLERARRGGTRTAVISTALKVRGVPWA